MRRGCTGLLWAALNTHAAVSNWSLTVVKAGGGDELKIECVHPAEMDNGHLYDRRKEAWVGLPGTFNKREDFLSSALLSSALPQVCLLLQSRNRCLIVLHGG